MNAAEYLRAQGWRGEGHSLDHTNRGLAKPLLITRKLEPAGLGTKKNDFSNQWWLTAWNPSSKSPQSAAPQGSRLSATRGLYSYFTKAHILAGTLSATPSPQATTTSPGHIESNKMSSASVDKKRKRDSKDASKKLKRSKANPDEINLTATNDGEAASVNDAEVSKKTVGLAQQPDKGRKDHEKKKMKKKSADAAQSTVDYDVSTRAGTLPQDHDNAESFLAAAPPDAETLRKEASRAKRNAKMELLRKQRKEHKKEKKALRAAEKEATAERLKATREKKQTKYDRERMKREQKRAARLAADPGALVEQERLRKEEKKKNAEQRALRAAMAEERTKAKLERKAKRKAEKRAAKKAQLDVTAQASA